MKRLLSLLFAFAAVCTALAQSRTEEFRVESTVLGCEKVCTVYLPDGYDSSKENYPVLFLLHGAGGTHTDWLKKGSMRQIADELFAEGKARPMIVIMPDAAGSKADYQGEHMGYFDVPGWSYERFFFEEFIPTVERHYRTHGDREHRAIAGLSMGGGATATYALRHPEFFSSACPISARLEGRPGNPNGVQSDDYVQSVVDNGALAILRNMSDQQIVPLRAVRWRVDCGDDDFLYEGNIHFYELMRQRRIPLEYRMRDGGHTWRYWQSALPDVLTFVSAGFGK